MMNTLIQDVRFGMRGMKKRPGFTLVAVLTLALGIGANTAIFSVVDAVLLQPLPYPEADRLVFLWTTYPAQGADTSGSSLPDYREWRDQTQSFDGLAGFYYGNFNLSAEGGEPEQVQGAYVSHNLFDVLKVAPATGRTFTSAEEEYGRHRVVLLSHGLWQRRFGGREDVVGRVVRVGGESYTVAGVMPAGMAFFDNVPEAELWAPIAFAPGDSMDTRNNYFVTLVGRLKVGVTAAQAREDVAAVAAVMEKKYPENRGLSGTVVGAGEQLVGESRTALLVLLGAVGFVLLIACVNVANLFLARSSARQRELAIRASLGASRGRLIRQMVGESLPMALAGGGAGLLLANWGVTWLSSLLPATLPRHNAIEVNLRILLFAFAASLFTVVIFGLLPALQMAKTDLTLALNEGGRSGVGGGRGRLRKLLVVSELALALVLLVGAGLMTRSFAELRATETGVAAHNVLTMRVALPDAKYPIPINASDPRHPAGMAFFDQLLARVESVPGVKAAAAGTMLPLGAGMGWGKRFSIEGAPAPPSLDQVPGVSFALISPDYFRTFGVGVRQGQTFRPEDNETSQPVAVINESAARRFFPDKDPVGETIFLGAPEHLLPPEARDSHTPRRLIVGVVADVKGGSLSQPTQPTVYAPYHQYRLEGWTNAMMIAVQTETAPETLIPTLTAQVRSLDSDQPVSSVRTVPQLLDRSLSDAKFTMFLLGLFAAVATTLAGVGIYGVMSYAVAQRTHEIGLRMALGARPADVLRLVMRQGAFLTAIGVTAGLAAAFALTRLMETLLFGVSATDPLTFVAVATLITGVALLACYVPARRATKVDPMVALRNE